MIFIWDSFEITHPRIRVNIHCVQIICGNCVTESIESYFLFCYFHWTINSKPYSREFGTESENTSTPSGRQSLIVESWFDFVCFLKNYYSNLGMWYDTFWDTQRPLSHNRVCSFSCGYMLCFSSYLIYYA